MKHKTYQAAHDFLKKHPVGVLATVGPNGDPHAATIYFSVSPTLHVYFLTKTGTKKADNLRHNNHAMLVVYEPKTQTTVQVAGEVSEVHDHAAVNDIFAGMLGASLDTSGKSVPPLVKLKESGDFVAYELTPKDVHMNEYAKIKPYGDQELIKPPEDAENEANPSIN